MEKIPEDRWVDERLASLEPHWKSDLTRGLAMLEGKLKPQPRRRAWTWVLASTAAGLVLGTALLPAPRAIAQRLWDRIVLNRVDVVRVDLSDLPLKMHVTTNGYEKGVKDLNDAEQRAGFRPHVPAGAVFIADSPISIIQQMTLEQTISVHDLQSALTKVGAGEVQVPTEWEGLTLRTDLGPIVGFDYEGAQILQCRPIEVAVPPGFDLERFADVAFRSVGISRWEARAMAQKFVAHPSWFLDIPPDEVVNIQEVSLRNGPALVIEDFDDKGASERVTVIRSSRDRVFSVSSKTRKVSVRVAESLP